VAWMVLITGAKEWKVRKRVIRGASGMRYTGYLGSRGSRAPHEHSQPHNDTVAHT
jgi:hypothetical protein